MHEHKFSCFIFFYLICCWRNLLVQVACKPTADTAVWNAVGQSPIVALHYNYLSYRRNVSSSFATIETLTDMVE